MLILSSNVSDVFTKILKLSSEVSECKPLAGGRRAASRVLAARLHGRAMQLHSIKTRVESKAPMVSALEATKRCNAFKLCFQFEVAAVQHGGHHRVHGGGGTGRGLHSFTFQLNLSRV